MLADGGDKLEQVAWSYPEPFADDGALAGHLALYPHRLICTVNGERVRPQPSSGGW